jgi:small subunit ribosomal protein S3Ae
MAKTDEKPQRTTAKKVKDKWRAKGWYAIYAPEMFSSQLLGETLADAPEKLIGRVCEATVHDLTGDFSRMHIKLKFGIHDIRGSNAYTKFIGHELTNDYVRRLTRRKRSKIDASFSVLTKDNFKVQIKPMAVAEKRIQSAQQTQIREFMNEVLKKNAAAMTLNEFVNKLISGELSKNIVVAVKAIYPMKKIEIRKTVVTEGAKKGDEKVPAGEEAKAEDEKPMETPVEGAETVETQPAEETEVQPPEATGKTE